MDACISSVFGLSEMYNFTLKIGNELSGIKLGLIRDGAGINEFNQFCVVLDRVANSRFIFFLITISKLFTDIYIFSDACFT